MAVRYAHNDEIKTRGSGEMAEYDYIIVGAGSAGGTLAARLSETATNKILLLEGVQPAIRMRECPFRSAC